MTAVFEAAGHRVVVKDAEPDLHPRAVAVHRAVERACPDAVAPLQAAAGGPGRQRSVFGFVDGPTVARAGVAALPRVAATPVDDLAGYDVATVPDTLVADLESEDDQDPERVGRLRAALPVFRAHAHELADRVPVTLDHPDLNDDNAILTDNVVLLDWEEAVPGCPLSPCTASWPSSTPHPTPSTLTSPPPPGNSTGNSSTAPSLWRR